MIVGSPWRAVVEDPSEKENEGVQRAQAPTTYILTGAICEAVKAPPASADFRDEKEEASEPSVPPPPPPPPRTQPRCTHGEQGVPNVKHACTRRPPPSAARYLLRMNARENIFLTAGTRAHLIKECTGMRM